MAGHGRATQGRRLSHPHTGSSKTATCSNHISLFPEYVCPLYHKIRQNKTGNFCRTPVPHSEEHEIDTKINLGDATCPILTGKRGPGAAVQRRAGAPDICTRFRDYGLLGLNKLPFFSNNCRPFIRIFPHIKLPLLLFLFSALL